MTLPQLGLAPRCRILCRHRLAAVSTPIGALGNLGINLLLQYSLSTVSFLAGRRQMLLLLAHSAATFSQQVPHSFASKTTTVRASNNGLRCSVTRTLRGIVMHGKYRSERFGVYMNSARSFVPARLTSTRLAQPVPPTTRSMKQALVEL